MMKRLIYLLILSKFLRFKFLFSMKRITLISIALGLLLLISQNTRAQAFQKGDINVGFGLGFGANETNQSVTRTSGSNGVSYEWVEAEALSPVSLFLSGTIEYGLSNKIGLALEGKLAATGLFFLPYGNKITHQDLKLKLNYHLFTSIIMICFLELLLECLI